MILHVDMDAFFASVEQLDAPWLRDRPLVVGSDSDRGVVAAASYRARKYGIHSAMPMFQARQRCRDLVIVPPRRHRYQAISQSAMAVLKTISPLVEQVSIDEAYVDISGCQRLMGSPLEIGHQIKDKIKLATDLTCSVGIAPLKFLAKIASDVHKPNGLFVIHPEQIAFFIESLPIEKVPGVGKKTHDQLVRMGIRTLGDIRLVSTSVLTSRFGKYGQRLHQLAMGVDLSAVTPHRPVKSFSSEATLPRNTIDRDVINSVILEHSSVVGRQLRNKGFYAQTISIKIKFDDFRSHTRSNTLSSSACETRKIYRTALGLMEGFPLSRPIRLVGVTASNLTSYPKATQTSLFENFQHKPSDWKKADRAMDKITAKFGRHAITKATLTHKK